MTPQENTSTRPKQVQSRRKVSSEELGDFVRSNDCVRIGKFMLGRCPSVRDQDDRDEVVMAAAWRCLQYHRDGAGSRLTTSFVQFMAWEIGRKKRSLGAKARRDRKRKLAEAEYASSRPVRVSPEEWRVDAADEVESLGPELSEVAEMFFLDGLSMARIAAQTGLTESSVRSKVAASRSLIQERWES